MNSIEFIAFLIVIMGVTSRIKYIWQGSKIRRAGSTKDVSCKFLFISFIVYILMFIHNIQTSDIIDAIFWLVGIGTTFYANIMAYKYSGYKGLKYFKYMFRSEEEGGILW